MVTIKQAKDQNKDKKQRKIFLGSLEKNITEKMLAQFFSRYGEIERVVVNREHYTNISRGSGFILFRNANSAQKVLNERRKFILNNKEFFCQPCLLRNEVNNQNAGFVSQVNKSEKKTRKIVKSSENSFKSKDKGHMRRNSKRTTGNLDWSSKQFSNHNSEEMVTEGSPKNNTDFVEFEREKFKRKSKRGKKRMRNATGVHHRSDQWYNRETVPYLYNDEEFSYRHSDSRQTPYTLPIYFPRKDSFDNLGKTGKNNFKNFFAMSQEANNKFLQGNICPNNYPSLLNDDHTSNFGVDFEKLTCFDDAYTSKPAVNWAKNGRLLPQRNYVINMQERRC